MTTWLRVNKNTTVLSTRRLRDRDLVAVLNFYVPFKETDKRYKKNQQIPAKVIALGLFYTSYILFPSV